MLNKNQLMYISHFLTLYEGGYKVALLKEAEKKEMVRLIVEVNNQCLAYTNGEKV